MSFAETCNRLQEMRRQAVEAKRGEMSDVEEIEGVRVQLRHFHSDRRQDRSEVHLDGYNFACEIETVPWNIFKPITVSYWVWLDLPKDKVIELILEAEARSAAPMEEFYPTENGPERWNASANTLSEVLALWKVWAPKYRPE